MSEAEMNSYRFGLGIEPTDEMLLKLMKEVALEAKEGNQKATEFYWKQTLDNIEKKKQIWSERIKSLLNA
ncbi:MAG: hypothetical protein IKV80_05805 [Bacteroidales bacterium]|jgi:hypothetical protein|nr:hypothetical protein [Bacteroidales bacterium]MBR5604029.1 hypothetical protein [Bacteroidales bacterium]